MWGLPNTKSPNLRRIDPADSVRTIARGRGEKKEEGKGKKRERGERGEGGFFSKKKIDLRT